MVMIHSFFVRRTFCLVAMILEPDFDLCWWQSYQWCEMFTFRRWQVSLLTESPFQLKRLSFREQNSSLSFLADSTIAWPVIFSRLTRSVDWMFIVVFHVHFFSIVLNIDIMIDIFCVWRIRLGFRLLVAFNLISPRDVQVMLLALLLLLVVVQLLLKVLEIFAVLF